MLQKQSQSLKNVLETYNALQKIELLFLMSRKIQEAQKKFLEVFKAKKKFLEDLKKNFPNFKKYFELIIGSQSSEKNFGTPAKPHKAWKKFFEHLNEFDRPGKNF